MLSLEAVLRHPALCGMRCVAGRGGLARGVANVAFLDYEPTQGSYANFYRDELVLSTMLFAKGQPTLAWQAMEGLMRRGVTAIAVKTVFIREFPPQVCAMAERTGTALLLYDGVYLEDVIAAVKGMLGQSAAFEKKDRLAARLAREQQPARCERLAQRLLGAAPPQVRCTACALPGQAAAGAWLGTLRSYDEKNATALYETALCYARCHGDAALAAKRLFQHPNTVRYRMQKAKVLLCGEGAEDKAFYEQLYLCAFLHGDL